MATVTFQPRNGEFIFSEANGTLSRESLIIAPNSGDLESGTVLGKITASGHYTRYDNAAANGLQTAAAILYERIQNSPDPQIAVAIVRCAEVKSDLLIWNPTNSATAMTDGIADLTLQYVIVRN